MKEPELKKLMDDKQKVDDKIKYYLEKKIISKVESQAEIAGHTAKAEHNLNFLDEISPKYPDWMLIACYYSAYHMALSLILTKGYFSKNHDATLCILIKHFYKKGLTEEDVKLLNTFDTNDILFYVQTKQEREKASYSSKILFDKQLIKDIKIKTLLFINKTKEIIENTR